jgi:hypothetical protein
MVETIAEKNARLRALREARDGTPEEQAECRKAAAYAKTIRSMHNAERRIRRLVVRLEESMGERLPNHIRSKLPMEK